MKGSNRVKGLIALVSVIALSIPVAASAGVLDSGTRDARIHVSYGDLDLTKTAGVSTLYARLKAAARQACGPTKFIEAGSVQRKLQNEACYDSLLSRAVEKLGNDDVTAIHTG